MATAYKVIAQASPSANTDVDVYTVPSATEAVLSTISVANRSESLSVYSIAIRVDGASLSDKDYIVYRSELPPTTSIFLTLGITLSAADVITVRSSSGQISFNIFGSEIS